MALPRPVRRLVERVLAWYHTSESKLALWTRAARDALFGEMPLLASGTALFAILATVPTLAAAVGLYSLVADPSQIQAHLASLASVLPDSVATFIGEQLQRQAARSQGELGFAVGTSVAIAMWSARGVAGGIIDTLNRAYRVRERRSWLARQGIHFAIAIGALIGVMLFFAAVVVLPTLGAALHLERHPNLEFVTLLRWPVLAVVVFVAMLLVYRFAPSPRPLGTRLHLWPGALISTALLFVVSLGLSVWVERVADYNVFYGAFGSVVVTILWFYFSVIAVVLGGFANAELERRDGAPAPDRSMY